MARAVLFDFDGTMLDTESSVLLAWREEYAHHGLRLDEEAWLAALGADQDRYAVLAELVGPSYDVINSRARKQAREEELVAALQLREGIEECLRRARAESLRTAVVSSSSSTWVRSHLKRFSLLDQFDHVVTREDAARSKPHPDLYETALTRLQVSAQDAIAIEDSANGVAAARAAGIRCIAYPNPVTIRQDLNHAHAIAGPDLWKQVAALAGLSGGGS